MFDILPVDPLQTHRNIPQQGDPLAKPSLELLHYQTFLVFALHPATRQELGVQNHSIFGSTSVSSFHRRAPKDDDELEESLLNVLGMKDWTVRLTKDEKGNEVVRFGGRITGYVRPGLDRFVADPRLVEDFGVYDINDLTEGQLAEYFAAQEQGQMYRLEKIGNKWVKIPINEFFELDEDESDEDEPDDRSEKDGKCDM